MSSRSKKTSNVTTNEEKVLKIITNHQDVDINFIMQETKLSIRTVRHKLTRMIKKGDIRKRNNLSDMRRIFYEAEDE